MPLRRRSHRSRMGRHAPVPYPPTAFRHRHRDTLASMAAKNTNQRQAALSKSFFLAHAQGKANLNQPGAKPGGIPTDGGCAWLPGTSGVQAASGEKPAAARAISKGYYSGSSRAPCGGALSPSGSTS